MDRLFNSKDKDGNEVVLKFLKPTLKVQTEADFLFRQYYSKALRMGIITNAEAFELLKKNGIWTDADEVRGRELKDKITKLEEEFAAPSLSNEEGLAKVTHVKLLREELSDLNAKISSVTSNTAESLSVDYKNQYLASACVVNNATGKKVFKDVDDFLARADEQVTIDSFTQAILLNYEKSFKVELSSDPMGDLPENKWLKEREASLLKAEEVKKEEVEAQEVKEVTGDGLLVVKEKKKRGPKKAV